MKREILYLKTKPSFSGKTTAVSSLDGGKKKCSTHAKTIPISSRSNQQMLNAVREKDILKFNDLEVKYKQPSSLTGIVFHDKHGSQLHGSNTTILVNSNKQFFRFNNIESVWKTEWTVRNECNESVSYDKSPLVKAIKSGKCCKEFLNIRTKSGEERWVYFVSQPYPTGSGPESWCIMTNISDVTTEQKQLARTGNKLVLSSLATRLPVLSWIVSGDGDLLFANKAFYSYFGLKEKLAAGKKLVALIPVSISNKLYNKYLKALDTGRSLQTSERIKLIDGRNFTARITIFQVTGPDGKKLIAGNSVHMPERPKKKKDTKERLAMLSHATSDAIWEWDMRTGHIYRNQPLMKMIGYEGEYFRGLSWWLRNIHPDDRRRIISRVKETSTRLEPSWQEEYRFKCADGNYRHVLDRGYIVYENGSAIRMIGSLTDVTKVRQLEDELVREKLRRQTEIAETVIRVQEMERTHIGHELHDNINQILCSARLFIDILKTADDTQQPIKNKGMEYISLAIEEIRKLSRELVVPQLKQQGLAESIHSLIDDMHATSSIKFSFIHDADSERMATEKKVTLYRIVQEQVKNILKHSKATIAGISLRTTGKELKLMIWDNGVGFSPHQVSHGIGLSNIRDRVSFYNGDVEILSAKDAGCKLLITLPAV